MLKLHNMTDEDHVDRRREQLSWAIWGYCRENRHSMVTEIHTKQIDAMVKKHTQDLLEKIDKLEKKIELLLAPPPKGKKPSQKLIALRKLAKG